MPDSVIIFCEEGGADRLKRHTGVTHRCHGTIYTDHRPRLFCSNHRHHATCCTLISTCPVCGDALGPADVNKHMSTPHEAREIVTKAPADIDKAMKVDEEQETKEFWPCSYCQETVDRNEYHAHVQACKEALHRAVDQGSSRSSSSTRFQYWCSTGWRHGMTGHEIFADSYYCRAQRKYYCNYHKHANECCDKVVPKVETTSPTTPVTTAVPEERIRFVRVTGEQD